MAARRGTMSAASSRSNNTGRVGGFFVLLGALIYLVVVFSWYSTIGSNGLAINGDWLSLSGWFGPIIAAVSVISAIVLFFMGLGALFGKMGQDMKSMFTMALWRFVMMAGISTVIVSGGSSVLGGSGFIWTVIAFVLTYIGAMVSM